MDVYVCVSVWVRACVCVSSNSNTHKMIPTFKDKLLLLRIDADNLHL